MGWKIKLNIKANDKLMLNSYLIKYIHILKIN